MLSIRKALKEADIENQSAEEYAKFLEDEVAKKLVPQEFKQNKQAMEIVVAEIAELVRANPESILESRHNKRTTSTEFKRLIIQEMSKSESTNVLVTFYEFMNTIVKNAVAHSSIIKDKEIAKKYHEGVLDIIKNIRNYPEILAFIAMALTDVPFYANSK